MFHKRTLTCAAMLSFFIASASVAQMSVVTPAVGLKIREMGKGLSPEIMSTTTQLYLPLHANVPRDGAKATKDEKCGLDERQRLDVYEPLKKPNRLMPILMFVHGGAFVAGDKSPAGTPFYDNIGYYFSRNNVLTIVSTYRLAPKHKWPAGTEDVASALAWVRKNGGRFGGDTDRVFLMGHSAGGARRVASYVFQEEYQLKEGDGLAGAIFMSGIYDPAKAPSPAYYGEDASRYPSMAPIRYIEGRKIPVFIAFAEFDPYFFDVQTSDLFQALCQRDKACPTIKQVMGHNHLSEAYHINTGDESVGPDILEFTRAHASHGKP